MSDTPDTPDQEDDWDYGPTGPLAPLYHRLGEAWPGYMIAPPFGWLDLVLELDQSLSEVVPDYTLAQVKSKFAGLRYYIDEYGTSDPDTVSQAEALISAAESRSYTLCEECGEPGTLNTHYGWRETVCDEHKRTD